MDAKYASCLLVSKGAEGAPEKCFIVQNQQLKENNQRLINVAIGYLGPKGEPTMVVTRPSPWRLVFFASAATRPCRFRCR
jgi:hypothetical protein